MPSNTQRLPNLNPKSSGRLLRHFFNFTIKRSVSIVGFPRAETSHCPVTKSSSTSDPTVQILRFSGIPRYSTKSSQQTEKAVTPPPIKIIAYLNLIILICIIYITILFVIYFLHLLSNNLMFYKFMLSTIYLINKIILGLVEI